MKKCIFVVTLLLMATFSINAQTFNEKLYFDSADSLTDSLRADHYQINEYDDSSKIAGTVSYYNKENILTAVVHFSNIKLHKREGSAKYYYDNGQLQFSYNNYKDGYDGEFLGYYRNGRLKRKDLFDKEKLIRGDCYTSEGKDTTYYDFEIMPKFPGGEEKLLKYLSKNIHYPKYSVENNISGKVYVKFVIAKNGAVEDAKVIRGVNNECDEEALRVVRNMPKWSPGYQDGVPVKVQFVLPINFSLR